MQMNVKPIPTLDARINEIRGLTADIVNQEILPNERKLMAAWQHGASDDVRHEARALRESIKAKVKQAGLWAPHLPPEYGGAGLGFLEHAYMNEVLAYSIGAAALFGVVAPNSGNQTILLKYGTEEQKKKWLVPLTEGKMESGFSMTEPDSAGSDPRSIKTTARRDGDEWVINGHKWFTSNGFRADFLIVMCRTEGAGADNGRMTQIIVPKKTPGVRIVRGVEVWGRQSDHCEIVYEDVRVPLAQYAVFVCPILSGSGVRVKLLEAFAAGIPVVSTRLGAEGLTDRDGEICKLADHPQQFADAVVELLGDEKQAAEMARRARAEVAAKRDMRKMTEAMVECYRAQVARMR